MNSSESGKDKIKKICEILEKETLEPARNEAQRLIQDAKAKADEILVQAQQEAQQLLQTAQKQIERNQTLFHASLKQGFSAIKEQLRQELQTTLVLPSFTDWVRSHVHEAMTEAQFVQAMIRAIDQAGLQGQVAVYVAKEVSVDAVNALLGQQILDRLEKGSVQVGTFGAGVQLRLEAHHLILDVTEESLVDLLTTYVAKPFREILFAP